ncbi:dif-1 domain protein, partial [Cooperia oncophora]
MPRPKPGEPPLFRGALDCVKQTVAKEGFFALYKGMAAPLAGVSPLFAVFFAGCAVGRHLQTSDPNQEMTFIQNMNSGALAGVFTTIIMVPGERIKGGVRSRSFYLFCHVEHLHDQRCNPQGHAPSVVTFKWPLDVSARLYSNGGLTSSLYQTGTDIPASAAYLSVYEFLKKKFSGEGAQRTLSPGSTLLAGGLAGIAN